MATSDQQSAMRLGFIGLGGMGSRMALVILLVAKGAGAFSLDLAVYDSFVAG